MARPRSARLLWLLALAAPARTGHASERHAGSRLPGQLRCAGAHCLSREACSSAKHCLKLRRLLRERHERQSDGMLECAGRNHTGRHRKECVHKPLWPRVVPLDYAAA